MISMLKKRAKAGSEGGFTLIELLVVVIIIAILAAIAIPMYLSQRQKGWEADAKSNLRNAAVAQESYYVDNSTYTTDEADLAVEGFNRSANVTVNYEAGDDGDLATSYCMDAVHDSGGGTFNLDSDSGEPQDGAC